MKSHDLLVFGFRGKREYQWGGGGGALGAVEKTSNDGMKEDPVPYWWEVTALSIASSLLAAPTRVE